MTRHHLLVDISNNNGAVDLARIKAAGIAGVWHKVTEGERFTDTFFAKRQMTARKIGLRFGGYHFARPRGSTSALIQARQFAYQLGHIERRDLCPVLDLEVSDGLDAQHIIEFARSFNHEFHRLRGVWPLLYSFPSFISGLRAQHVIGRGLWLASFGRNDGTEHPFEVPRPYKKALAHQFTSNARVAGVSGDCDLSTARRLVPLLAKGWRGL